MKDDKFEKLSDNDIETISGGIVHETEGFMGMKAYDKFDSNGNYEGTSLFKPKNHILVGDITYEQLKKDGNIETINERNEINKALDTRK